MILTEQPVGNTKGVGARLIVFPCLHASLPIKCSFQLAKNGDLNKESLSAWRAEAAGAIASAHHRGLDFNSNRANVIASLSLVVVRHDILNPFTLNLVTTTMDKD